MQPSHHSPLFAAEGATPLHLAAAKGELGTVRLLIENGADTTKTTNVRCLSNVGRRSCPLTPALQSGRTPVDCVKDEATLFVLRSAADAVGDGAKVSTILPSLARSASDAAMASPKAAPPPAPALPEELTTWLAGLSLGAYAEPLGLASMADVELMEDEDLKEAGLKPAERKRFLAAKKLLGPS